MKHKSYERQCNMNSRLKGEKRHSEPVDEKCHILHHQRQIYRFRRYQDPDSRLQQLLPSVSVETINAPFLMMKTTFEDRVCQKIAKHVIEKINFKLVVDKIKSRTSIWISQ